MGPLARFDCSQLAALHRECLSDSLVSCLGAAYARAFYRYMSRSPHEQVFIKRDAGQIVSACVLSLSPQTLTRRLAIHTPLLWFVAMGVFRRSVRRALVGSLPRRSAAPEKAPRSMPEVILIFTMPRVRGRRFGAALLTECDQFLSAQGHGRYLVRTIDDQANAALQFYAENAFVECGRCTERGRPFRLLSREISATLR